MASSNIGFLPPAPVTGSTFARGRKAVCQFHTVQRTSGFTSPFFLRRIRGRPFLPWPLFSVRCSDEVDPGQGTESKEGDDREFVHWSDPKSEKDAFGRDPRKETAFWMDAAKSVLESDEVQKAVAEHTADGGDGLTDEQRAYMEFVKSLDEGKSDT